MSHWLELMQRRASVLGTMRDHDAMIRLSVRMGVPFDDDEVHEANAQRMAEISSTWPGWMRRLIGQ
jgi:hypothetical protein